jgi:hypothetical protein
VISDAALFYFRPAIDKPLDIFKEKYISSYNPHSGTHIALVLSDYPSADLPGKEKP